MSRPTECIVKSDFMSSDAKAWHILQNTYSGPQIHIREFRDNVCGEVTCREYIISDKDKNHINWRINNE